MEQIILIGTMKTAWPSFFAELLRSQYTVRLITPDITSGLNAPDWLPVYGMTDFLLNESWRQARRLYLLGDSPQDKKIFELFKQLPGPIFLTGPTLYGLAKSLGKSEFSQAIEHADPLNAPAILGAIAEGREALGAKTLFPFHNLPGLKDADLSLNNIKTWQGIFGQLDVSEQHIHAKPPQLLIAADQKHSELAEIAITLLKASDNGFIDCSLYDQRKTPIDAVAKSQIILDLMSTKEWLSPIALAALLLNRPCLSLFKDDAIRREAGNFLSLPPLTGPYELSLLIAREIRRIGDRIHNLQSSSPVPDIQKDRPDLQGVTDHLLTFLPIPDITGPAPDRAQVWLRNQLKQPDNKPKPKNANPGEAIIIGPTPPKAYLKTQNNLMIGPRFADPITALYLSEWADCPPSQAVFKAGYDGIICKGNIPYYIFNKLGTKQLNQETVQQKLRRSGPYIRFNQLGNADFQYRLEHQTTSLKVQPPMALFDKKAGQIIEHEGHLWRCDEDYQSLNALLSLAGFAKITVSLTGPYSALLVGMPQKAVELRRNKNYSFDIPAIGYLPMSFSLLDKKGNITTLYPLRRSLVKKLISITPHLA